MLHMERVTKFFERCQAFDQEVFIVMTEDEVHCLEAMAAKNSTNKNKYILQQLHQEMIKCKGIMLVNCSLSW